MTAKQLEEETGCKIMVRGRGSSRTVSGVVCGVEGSAAAVADLYHRSLVVLFTAGAAARAHPRRGPRGQGGDEAEEGCRENQPAPDAPGKWKSTVGVRLGQIDD